MSLHREHIRLLLLTVLTLLTRFAIGWAPFDDAFITWRYAHNLVEGNGYVYNIGERVLGITTPLFGILLALFHFISGIYFESLAWGLGLTAEATTVCLIYLITQQLHLSRPLGLMLCAAYATNPAAARLANGGMETPLFVLSLLASLYFFLRMSNKGIGFSLAVATLLRPEGLIATCIMLALLTVRRWWRAVGTVLLSWAIPVVPWVLFATWYYGSPLPHSIIAKQAAYQVLPYSALVSLMAQLVYWISPNPGDAGIPLVVALTSSLVPVFFGILKGGSSRWQGWFIPLFFIGYAAFYVVSNPVIFLWYIAPFVPLMLLLAGIGAEQGMKIKQGWLAFSLLLVLQLWQLTNGSAYLLMEPDAARYWLYTEAANWIQENGDTKAVIAAPEIGVLGYHLPEAYILDTVGLVSPQSIPYYENRSSQARAGSVPSRLIVEKEPDYLISLEVFTQDMHSDRAFLEKYSKAHRIPTVVYDSNYLHIFVRKDVAATKGRHDVVQSSTRKD